MIEAKFPVFAKLSEPFVARYVRIIPSVLGSMRAELYGCSVEERPPYIGRYTSLGLISYGDLALLNSGYKMASKIEGKATVITCVLNYINMCNQMVMSEIRE